ncbi:MAG: GNAT family N-acetyltransferase [Candidatus Heimdallarchaeota archaeon]|nr:GNAT family N-acetyltransferase [Candidatus Heimdallarchaeota archaeon]
MKSKQFFARHLTRNDIVRHGLSRPGHHVFYRMEMEYDAALNVYSSLVDKLNEIQISKDITIKSLKHPKETNEFLFLYNAIFLMAPDPSRTITFEEAIGFPEERTFVAWLWSGMAGFIYLTIEKDPLGSDETVGAIAGIGVLAKYRGRKIGLKLLKHAIDYFRDKGITKLVCEIYEHNEASMRMFSGLGMSVVGTMILEEEQPEVVL